MVNPYWVFCTKPAWLRHVEEKDYEQRRSFDTSALEW